MINLRLTLRLNTLCVKVIANKEIFTQIDVRYHSMGIFSLF